MAFILIKENRKRTPGSDVRGQSIAELIALLFSNHQHFEIFGGQFVFPGEGPELGAEYLNFRKSKRP